MEMEMEGETKKQEIKSSEKSSSSDEDARKGKPKKRTKPNSDSQDSNLTHLTRDFCQLIQVRTVGGLLDIWRHASAIILIYYFFFLGSLPKNVNWNCPTRHSN
jgi:hypothetical protein